MSDHEVIRTELRQMLEDTMEARWTQPRTEAAASPALAEAIETSWTVCAQNPFRLACQCGICDILADYWAFPVVIREAARA